MHRETYGKLNAIVTRDEGPVVVLLHGFGAPGTDLVGLAGALGVSGLRFVFPEAPLALPPIYGDGRAWWMLDARRLEEAMMRGVPVDLRGEDPEGLRSARELLEGLLDQVESRFGGPPIIGGFSQGAMVATDLALSSDRPLAGLALLSGALLAESRWTQAMKARAGLPVFQSHGQRDQLLGFDGAEALQNAMKAAGMKTTWMPFQGAHEIPLSVLEGLGAFLRSACG